jgi:hypothetical protein
MSDDEADLREAEREVKRLGAELAVSQAQVRTLRLKLGKATVAEQEAADDAPQPEGEWASTLDFVANRTGGFRWGAKVTKSHRGMVEVTMPVTTGTHDSDIMFACTKIGKCVYSAAAYVLFAWLVAVVFVW